MRELTSLMAVLLMVGGVANPHGVAHAQNRMDAEADIVVRAKPLWETEKALRDCLSRRCPPDQDIDATLAHAENQMLAGDYRGSRATLLASRQRNRRYAPQFPVKVADLLYATSRLSSLNGLPAKADVNQREALYALQAGLGPDDPRILQQKIAIGASYMQRGKFKVADDMYRAVAFRAHEVGQPGVEALALLWRAIMYMVLSNAQSTFRQIARQAIADLAAVQGADAAPFRDVAPVLSARVERSQLRGDVPASRPVLLYTPAKEFEDAVWTAPVAGLGLTGGSQFAWVDIVFEITSAGNVADVAVQRRSENSSERWINHLVAAVKKRRYAPITQAVNSARVERFVAIYDMTGKAGSSLPVRSQIARIETIDLTLDPAPAASGAR